MNARARMITGVVLLAAGAAPARADDDRVLSVADRGDHVEITARGASVAQGARPEARGIWIDVLLAGLPKSGGRVAVPNDRTLKRAEVVITGDRPRLSVLLHHDMSGVEFAGNAVVEQSLAGVVLRVPRESDRRPVPYVARPADEVEYGPTPDPRPPLSTPPRRTPVDAALTSVAPRALAPAAPRPIGPPVAPVAPPAPVVADGRPSAVALHAASDQPPSPSGLPATSVAPGTTAVSIDGVALATAAAGEPLTLLDDEPRLLGDREEGRTALFGVLLMLSLCGIAVLLLARRRRADLPAAELLRVVSTCHLSAKVRVVVVAIGDRQLLLSVSEQGARVLARWRVGSDSERVTLAMEEPTEVSRGAALHEAVGRGYQARAATTAELDVDIDLDLGLEPGPDLDPGLGLGTAIDRGAARAGGGHPGRDPWSDAPSGGPFGAPAQPLSSFGAFMPRPSSSPAVAGLLKLRRRGAEEVASGDPAADEEWARELLSAMRSAPEAIR